MEILLTNQCSFNPARALRDSIHRKTGIYLRVLAGEPILQSPPLIRYGNTWHDFRENDTKFNSPEFIRTTGNKLDFAISMATNGIYSPVFHRDLENITFPCVIRQTLNAHGGVGIIFCKDINELLSQWNPGRDHWTPFVKMDFELRIHILGGELKRIFKKVKDNEVEFPIRNMENGYHFSLRNNDNYKKLNILTQRMTEVFGTDAFYSLDVGWDSVKKEYFVIEANSCSGLNSHTVEIYADYLIQKLGDKLK
jgi:hypothetical protein